MLPRPLKLRSDLRVSRQTTAEGVSFVVKDPATGRFFRLREPEYFIAHQLDGVTPLSVVRQRVEEKFGAPVSLKTIVPFIKSLRRLRLLEQPDGQHLAPSGGRIRGSPLYVRLRAFNPDRLLARLVGKVWFCFTPHFLVLSGLLIVLAAGIAILDGDEFWRDVPRLYRVDALVLTWVTAVLVSAAHEFAHGVTCKHFGGEVREMGFLLIYFHPALYCNVSESWLFPEKSKRLWVTFAGAYFELCVLALATVTWRVTDTDTTLNLLALGVMVTSSIKVCLNLIPLIKLDGYYLLSDALEIPNLRATAFGYLRRAIGRLWQTRQRSAHQPTPRQRRIYLAYGMVAGVYSFAILGSITWHVGGLLVERYQAAGFLLYTGLMMIMFRRPLKRVLAPSARLLAVWPKRIRTMRRPLKLIVVLALAVALLFLVRLELNVAGEFKVLPLHNTEVRAEVEGVIQSVFVDEGQRVGKGDRIADLADRDYRTELRKVEAESDEKRAKLKMLKAGSRAEDIEIARSTLETAKTRRHHAQQRLEEAELTYAARLAKARSDLAKAQERLRYARSNLTRLSTLFSAELISQRDFEQAEERAAVADKDEETAQAELRIVLADNLSDLRKEVAVTRREAEEAHARLKLLLAGSRPEEIEGMEAEVARLAAQRSQLLDQLELVRVASPMAGVITTPKVREKVGQYMKKGDLIAEVHALTTITAEIVVSEKEIGDVQVGYPVVVRARAFPEETFYGIVAAIAPAAAGDDKETWRGKSVRVATQIDNADLRLKAEMTGNAKVSCGKRRVVELLTRRIVRYVRVEFWSWW
jgi:multidrug resistance efflux pump